MSIGIIRVEGLGAFMKRLFYIGFRLQFFRSTWGSRLMACGLDAFRESLQASCQITTNATQVIL